METRLSAIDYVQRGAHALLFAAILAYAFVFCFKSGERGFFPLDQSIMFDGAYRITAGQVPYKDFVIPVGPGVFWLQALVFKVCGVSFASYLLGAAVVNVLATALSMLIVSMLFPEHRYPTPIAGFLTATWFYPPYGSPNMEQTAFFFSLLGIACSAAAICCRTKNCLGQGLLLGIAGSCAVLSFLTKQNAGAFILPVYPLMFLAAFAPQRRDLVVAGTWFAIGVVLAAGAFVTWLFFQSNPELFQEHFFRIPGREGTSRIFNAKWRFIREVLGGSNPDFVRTSMVASMALGVFTLWVYRYRQWLNHGASRKTALAAILCICLPVFQSAFVAFTNNQWTEGMPFAGTVVACAIGLAVQLFDRMCERTIVFGTARPILGWGAATLLLGVGIVVSDIVRSLAPATVALVLVAVGGIIGVFQVILVSPARSDPGTKIREIGTVARRRLFVIAVMIAVAGCAMQGIKYSWNRSVHDIFSESEFTTYTTIPGLENLKWGHPTAIHGIEFKEDDLATLVERLKHEKKPFFVFPDFTILYGLVGRPAPQPILWFHKGLTYPRVYDESLDRWLVESLARHNVELIVLEKECWWGTNQLNDFPLLEAYVRDDFAAEDDIGPFEIRRRVAGHSPH